MNIQAMMKQAQKIQKDMLAAKEEINNTTFEGKSSFVTVKVKGSKEIETINIDTESIEKEDIEMLEDMLVVAINDAMKQIDKETDKKMGKFTQGMPGLF
ncbi:MAG: YbaB/EbfC family nucleoid-associated protein [Firmicutes bacterium]|nr:YbaB/EbfC family nucleoid-associated protein [Bacillota bacterium]